MIALEDIGIAAVDVVAELVGIATLTAARRLLGGDLRALDVAVTHACEAAKDRSGDHLASIVGREPVDPWDDTVLKMASPNALLAMIASSQLPWTRRLRAACKIASNNGSDAISMVFPDFHGAPSNRACKRSIFARPYI